MLKPADFIVAIYADNPARRELKEDLGDGETFWDDWPRERLLMEVRLLYSALLASDQALRFVAANAGPGDPFFHGESGTGREGIDVAKAALAPYVDRSSEIYRTYYRNRHFLLLGGCHGYAWHTCPDGHLLGPNREGVHDETCIMPGCGKPTRPLTWADFEDAVKPEVVVVESGEAPPSAIDQKRAELALWAFNPPRNQEVEFAEWWGQYLRGLGSGGQFGTHDPEEHRAEHDAAWAAWMARAIRAAADELARREGGEA